jgi:hypothetical protein
MLFRRYLEAVLPEYEGMGDRNEAEIIKRLFFDKDGVPLEPHAQRKLLAEARTKMKLSEEDFRKLQHRLFREFAEFLVDLEPRRHPSSGINDAC